MSGKGEGKRHNRAAQSQQHGFQEPASDHSPEPGALADVAESVESEKEKVLKRMRRLEEKRREEESKLPGTES
jgi:hypothetical protein